MVIDDTGTNDVHGPEMYSGEGWPEPVKMILQEVGIGDYAIDQLSSGTRDSILGEIDKMERVHSRKAKNKPKTKKILYGIKAPVSMLMLPMFNEYWSSSGGGGQPGWKFIHVVRDGRDIAFSGNISPVRKFYEFSAKTAGRGGGSSTEVKQMQLWNDWNADVSVWCKREAKRNPNFEVLTIRLEDFVAPETRYSVVKEVADFVGSPVGECELCKVAEKGSVRKMEEEGGG
ncbi:hypothetical protein TL16_g05211 [Triparma laevis f. inornata]|uniref:Sulfotransferase n=1 Tax=Triparma laevis f. inornata TaxID=1714386 RepID=A0A9W7AKX9_9STRA|nr:hypothetical protein TL16_g05211 [Triparma laevis f. inornata]